MARWDSPEFFDICTRFGYRLCAQNDEGVFKPILRRPFIERALEELGTNSRPGVEEMLTWLGTQGVSLCHHEEDRSWSPIPAEEWDETVREVHRLMVRARKWNEFQQQMS